MISTLPRYRVECDASGEIWLLGPNQRRKLTLEQLARLARLICRGTTPAGVDVVGRPARY